VPHDPEGGEHEGDPEQQARSDADRVLPEGLARLRTRTPDDAGESVIAGWLAARRMR